MDLGGRKELNRQRGAQLSQQLVHDDRLSVCRAFRSVFVLYYLLLVPSIQSPTSQLGIQNSGDVLQRRVFILHDSDFKAQRSNSKAQQSESNAEPPNVLDNLTVTLWFHRLNFKALFQSLSSVL